MDDIYIYWMMVNGDVYIYIHIYMLLMIVYRYNIYMYIYILMIEINVCTLRTCVRMCMEFLFHLLGDDHTYTKEYPGIP